ncbi:MAG TPA: 30S ribosome-binding factor RbfA [Candidatus Acidoferrum sp.]|nr:30S ribosome-binding factor RbfA [Candidatus Acidoferrum sp.]
MSSTTHRHERVGEEIAHEINAMLAGELKDPRLEGSVIASEVRVQPDMKHARVFISVKGTNEEQADAIKALEHAAGFIRHELVERLQLRRLPELHFALDLSEERVERIEQLLKEVKEAEPAPVEIKKREPVRSKGKKKAKPSARKKSSR